MAVKTDIPEKLISIGVLKSEDAAAITREAEAAGISFEKAIVKLGYLSEERLLEFLTHIFSVEAVNPVGVEVPETVAEALSSV